jgi:hypothetical protein
MTLQSLSTKTCMQLVYEHGEKKLELEPLTGDIDPEKSDFTVGKMKVEVYDSTFYNNYPPVVDFSTFAT